MITQDPQLVTLIKRALRDKAARYMLAKSIARERSRDWTKKGPRGGAVYICAECKEVFPAKDIHIDHIEPVEPIDRIVDTWDEHISRLLCDPDKLQALCTPDHKAKTLRENELRRQFKALSK